MQRPTIELVIFKAANGRRPFVDWFDRLRDRVAQAAVVQRLDRLQSGNPGDCRSLGGGLIELRVDTGPGYRVYLSRFKADATVRYRKGEEMAGRRKKALKPMKQRTRRAALSYDQWLRARLAADPDLSVEYLRQVLEQFETPEELLLGLRRVAEVLGMSRVAEVAGLSRESLYRSLSAAGNPRLSTLVAVLRVAGLRLSVRPAA